KTIESKVGKININNKVLTNFVDGSNIEKSVNVNEKIIKVMQINLITKADVDEVIIGDNTNLKKIGKYMENIAITRLTQTKSRQLNYQSLFTMQMRKS
ncbi:MAG: hypothetical protein QMD06_04625, partial [Candidatus Altarchaeum sp.]|nr:hypothetical protein [Candidatus Altarchaeum sp.]